MARAFVLFMLLSSVSLFAQDTKPNPADYTIDVHVRTSQLVVSCGSVTNGGSICEWNQKLKVEIDGKDYDLSSRALRWHARVLRTGNYKARVLKEDAKQGYEYNRTYELLFPDGGTRNYDVAGESE